MSEAKLDRTDHSRSTWVGKARAVVMLIGFIGIPGLMIYGMSDDIRDDRDFTFMLIGFAFMLSMMTAPVLLCSVLLPTHKARLLGVPLFLVVCLVFLSALNSPNIRYPSLSGLVPWALMGMAILLALPQNYFMSGLYSRFFSLFHTKSP